MKKNDKVSYIVTKKCGRGFKISSREGEYIQELTKSHSLIKTKNGRQITIKTKNIRKE